MNKWWYVNNGKIRDDWSEEGFQDLLTEERFHSGLSLIMIQNTFS